MSYIGFNGKVGIIQRVLPIYRKPFFEKLASSGIEVSIFAGNPMSNEGIATADYLKNMSLQHAGNKYFKSPLGIICWQVGIKAWLNKFNPDILIVEANPRLISSVIAINWMKKRNRPVIGWGLGELPRKGFLFIIRIRQIIFKEFIRRLDGVIAYSTKAANDYIKTGIDKQRVFIAHNAIDNEESESFINIFGGNKGWIKAWKNSLKITPHLPIILFVGRLLSEKKVDVLIDACIPLFNKCQLLIVGDGPLRKNLEIKAISYQNNIIFTGHQTGETLAQCFIASDIFVLPGAGGLAIHQAMSYGKPVIVTFGDGTEKDLVKQDINGFIVEENNVDSLRKKINILLSEKELRDQMGKQSISIIRNEMNINSMVQSFHRALNSFRVP
jgi:glycosyltransferase involved in cell wall biosynthesis